MSDRDDPLFHCFWDRLTPRAQTVVAASAVPIMAKLRATSPYAPLDCGLASSAWARAFRRAGVPVKVIDGNFYRGRGEGLLSWPSSSDHVWLMVDGFLFDPTAGQFAAAGPIRLAYYHDSGPGA